MSRILRLLFLLTLCTAVSNLQMDARGRNNGNNGGNNSDAPHQQHSPSRHKRDEGSVRQTVQDKNNVPTQSVSRPNATNRRPDSNNRRPTNNNRPPTQNVDKWNNGHNPGNKHNFGQQDNIGRPGGNGSFGHQPSHGNSPGNGGSKRPAPNHMRPANINQVPPYAPHRPMMPPPVRYCPPPPPPPNFRPAPRAPRFSTILGVALGSAISYTIQQLINTGYYVSGYTNDAVYINDVMMLNMMWPTSTLYYRKGQLSGSEFLYSTPYYDPSRYNNVFTSLVRTYGPPASTSNLPGGGMTTTWFGYDGRYIVLQYSGATALDGVLRYYTTLSFGY